MNYELGYPTYSKSLQAAERATFREKNAVKRGAIPWSSHYGSSVAAYDHEFRSVQSMPIADRLAQQRLDHGSVAVLDVMGTADFRAVAPVDVQAHMTLVDWSGGEDPNTSVFDGSIIRISPWAKARRLHPQGYNSITCRPLFGWRSVTAEDIIQPEESNLITTVVMQRMVSSLAEGGVLDAQLPMFEDHTPWFAELEKVEGLAVAGDIFYSDKGYHRSVVEIQKKTGDKVQLPRITDVEYFPNTVNISSA
jgi:hypothetical protein